MVVTSLFSRDGIILGNHPREEGPSIFFDGSGKGRCFVGHEMFYSTFKLCAIYGFFAGRSLYWNLFIVKHKA